MFGFIFVDLHNYELHDININYTVLLYYHLVQYQSIKIICNYSLFIMNGASLYMSNAVFRFSSGYSSFRRDLRWNQTH